MKIIKIIFTTTLLLVTPILNAQPAQLSWGPERKEKGDVSFVGATTDRFFTTRTEGKNFFLESFDLASMASLSSEKIVWKDVDGKTKITLSQQFVFKDKVIFLGTTYHKKTKTHKLKWLVANNSGLVEKPWFDFIPAIENYKNCVFQAQLSEDKEHLILQVIASNKDEKDRIHILYVLDASLDIKWKQEIKASDDLHYLQIERIKHTDNGSVYLFAYSTPLTVSKKQVLKSKAILRQYTKGESQYKEFDIPVENKSLITSSLNLTIDENGYVRLCGYYQDYNEDKPAMAGSFLLKFTNAQLVSPIFVFSEFSQEFRLKMIELLHRASNAEKGTEFFKDYKVPPLMILVDGGYIGIMELVYSERYTVSNGSSTTYSYTYHCDHILAVRIDANGKILWDREIEKSGSGNYLYYGTFSRGDTINMIFYDSWKNFNEDGTRKTGELAGGDAYSGLLTIAWLSPDGNITYTPLLDMRNSKIRPRPRQTIQLNKHLAFIYGDANDKP
ncbi:MAG TPA: hypothetical protein DIW47_12570, partial [Bacteroidetes bacterium]|nr:hypothetical protein [Bacteroidota bacterium]